MSGTAREAILEQMLALVNTVAGITVYRSRDAALARSEEPTAVIEPEEEVVEFDSALLAKRLFHVRVTVFTRGSNATPAPDQVADPVIQAIHAKLMADPTLGGLCDRVIEQGTKWTMEVADQTALAAEMRYQVKYLTYAADLSQLA